MRALSRALLIAFALSPLLAWAVAFQSPDSIRAAAIGALGADGQAEATVDPQLRMPACAQPLAAAVVGPASVAVRCADNPGWQVYVPVRRQDGASAVPEGSPTSPGLRPLAGRRLQAVPPFAVEAPAPAVQRGDPVTLVSRAGGMEVRVAGRVLGAAPIGGTVSVENTASRRIIRGRLVGPGLVEVNL